MIYAATRVFVAEAPLHARAAIEEFIREKCWFDDETY
jgi:hypothetical protein